ncbi:MAG: PAS domain-containing sensor histidine kinase [Bacteroidota bacterium]
MNLPPDSTPLSKTELKKDINQIVSDEENRFEALFMHAAIGIIMVDKASRIVLSNRFADVLFGYQPGELTNQELEILIPQNVRDRHRKTYDEYTDQPKARPMGLGLDLNGRKKDGSHFPVEISLSHFHSDGNQYFICFVNDMTFKRRAEENLILKNEEIHKLNESLENEVVKRTNALVETLKSLEKSKRDLEVALNKEKELGELKSRFVSMASHEFRTPLTAIQSAASLIEKYENKEDQEKREKHTNRIKAAVGNLTDILEEFLSVGKLEEGRIELKSVNFELPALVNECKMELLSLLKESQEIQYSHVGDTNLTMDKSLLRKIISNLCSNAIKFSPEESTIKLTTQMTDSQLFLQISDSGIGISAEDQKHLFDRFFRGKNATNIQGTGLGLHIVARYIELLKGKIELESSLETGTTFKIKIPLNR